MPIVSESHTRTPVNGSALVHFVFSAAARPATPPADATEQDARALVDEIARRVPVILSEYTGIDVSRLAVIAAPELPMSDQHFFRFAAQIYAISKSMHISYAIHLSPMGPASRTFSGSAVHDARSAMANLFGSHRGLVKIIQSSKRGEREPPAEEHVDRLAYLMAVLVQCNESAALDKEEEALELMREHSCLSGVALHLSEAKSGSERANQRY